jgi:hypothetical protein
MHYHELRCAKLAAALGIKMLFALDIELYAQELISISLAITIGTLMYFFSI